MRSRRKDKQPARGPWPVVAMTESSLHKQGALAADDHFIEVKVGQIQQWSVFGSQQELPQPYAKIDIRRLRGMSGCGYSSRRLFFLTNGMPMANLEYLWHVDSRGRELRVVFSAPKLTTVWWGDDTEPAAEMAGFAERLVAQRDRALAELPPESRQLAGDYLALLQRSGLLAAVLTDREADGRPGASSALPRTYVGRWLRAAILGQRELRDQLAKTLNGRAQRWNYGEPAVVQTASELLARGYFGPVPSDRDIAWMADLICQALADDRSVDPRTAQAVIRSALGRADLAGVTSDDRFLVLSVMIGLLGRWLDLREATVDTLLGEAERMAFNRGAHPRLAPT